MKPRWVKHQWPGGWLLVLIIAIGVIAFWLVMTEESK